MIMKEMLKNVSEATGLSQKDVNVVYNAIVDEIYNETKLEETISVTIPKIGTLKIAPKDAYMAKNPRTGEAVEVPASRLVRISACKALKDVVKEGFAPKKKAPVKKATTAKKAVKKVAKKK